MFVKSHFGSSPNVILPWISFLCLRRVVRGLIMSRGTVEPPWRKGHRSRSRRTRTGSGWSGADWNESGWDDCERGGESASSWQAAIVEEEQRTWNELPEQSQRIAEHIEWMMQGVTGDPSASGENVSIEVARQPTQPSCPPLVSAYRAASSDDLCEEGRVDDCADEQSGSELADAGTEEPMDVGYITPKAKVKPISKPGPYARVNPNKDCTNEYLDLNAALLDCDSLSEDEEVEFEAVLACPHPVNWDEEFTLGEPREEDAKHLLTRDEVKMWATANELVTPTDFVFAFESAAEVRLKLGPATEVVWREISETGVRRNAASGWVLLCKLGEAQKLFDLPPKYTATHVKNLKKLRSSKSEQAQLEKIVGDPERPERVRQANVLFAMSWGPPARIPLLMQQLSQLRALDFRAMEVERFARFDHHSLAAHSLAWNNWVKWCSMQEEPEVPTEPTVVTFPLWLAAQGARASPTVLWSHFSWLHRVLGLQWKSPIQERPKGVRGTIIAGDSQAVPLDLEILLTFEGEAELANFLSSQRHFQRSILVKLGTSFLWGVCPRGKSKPGFVWGLPRFTTSDADLGADISYRWKGASVNADTALQFACAGLEGLPVKAGVAADTVRFLLSKRGVWNPELFTMRGLRRVQLTMLGQRSAPEEKKVAVGDWQQCIQRTGPSIATMPVLYDGDKVKTAAFMKFIRVETVRRVITNDPTKFDWRTFRARMKELDMDQVYQAAENALENDAVVDEIPPNLVPKWYRPAKQFFFSVDTVRAVKKFQSEKDEPNVKSDPVENEAPSEADVKAKTGSGLALRWVENDDDQSFRVCLGSLPPVCNGKLQGRRCTLLTLCMNLPGAVKGMVEGRNLLCG